MKPGDGVLRENTSHDDAAATNGEQPKSGSSPPRWIECGVDQR